MRSGAIQKSLLNTDSIYCDKIVEMVFLHFTMNAMTDIRVSAPQQERRAVKDYSNLFA